MAKVNRFYLLIAALICSKSYMISDASAGYFGEMNDAECYIAEKLWQFMLDNNYDDGNGIQNYTREQAINTYCGNSEVSEVEVNGSKAWCGELFEAAYLDFDDCLTEPVSSFQECSYAAEWGCGTYKCDAGMGYDDTDDKCVPCGYGTYQSFGDFYSASTGNYLYGHFCAGCPDAPSPLTETSKNYAASKNDCYIAKNSIWSFSDSTGSGSAFFGYASGSQDCYYDGSLGS